MSTRRRLSLPALLMLLVACSGGSAPSGSLSAPTFTATRSATISDPSAFTPLSGRIVFDNHEDVWTINADGTDLTRLTHSLAFEFHPSWSPDGARTAYRSDRGDESEIWVMNANGTGQRRLTASLSPAWSPDGSSIASPSPGHDPNAPLSGISIMNADGSGSTASRTPMAASTPRGRR
jgi:Tol biopolymer transport system component